MVGGGAGVRGEGWWEGCTFSMVSFVEGIQRKKLCGEGSIKKIVLKNLELLSKNMVQNCCKLLKFVANC